MQDSQDVGDDYSEPLNATSANFTAEVDPASAGAASDPDGDSMTFVVTGGPSHGQVAINQGIITYTGDSSFTGQDSFTYAASDGILQGNSSTVTVLMPQATAPQAPVTILATLGLQQDFSPQGPVPPGMRVLLIPNPATPYDYY